MLHERNRIRGPASSVIVVIAPGMDYSSAEMDQLLIEAVEDSVRIATINYPALLRPLSLEQLAQHTGGPYYTVQEQHYNVATSYISTYFKLANVMFSIAAHFYEGNLAGMPLEVRVCYSGKLYPVYCIIHISWKPFFSELRGSSFILHVHVLLIHIISKLKR